MRKWLVFILFIVGSCVIFAQNSPKALPADSLEKVETEEFEKTLDFLTYSWAIDKLAKKNCETQPNPETTEEMYRKRLKKLPHIIEMPFNSAVQSYIDILTIKRREHVEYMLGLSAYYFPIFENALDAAGIPLELKYIPIIESALNPRAVSRSGAAGLWQFMIGTSRYYDLKVNSLVDERFDPIKSSKAAAKYLKELYGIYGHWNLVIAAYNCGPGTINRAIRRAGGKRDFWQIYSFLPGQTRAYLPAFIGANYAMNFYNEHFLCPAPTRLPPATDTVVVNRRLHFQQISSVLEIPIEELRILNPQYKKDIIPGDIEPYAISLPVKHIGSFVDKLNEISLYEAETLINSRRDETSILPVKPFEQVSPRKIQHRKKQVSPSKYMVKKGETLTGIAKKHGLTLKQLKKMNNLDDKDEKIKKGQTLKVK